MVTGLHSDRISRGIGGIVVLWWYCPLNLPAFKSLVFLRTTSFPCPSFCSDFFVSISSFSALNATNSRGISNNYVCPNFFFKKCILAALSDSLPEYPRNRITCQSMQSTHLISRMPALIVYCNTVYKCN